MLDMTDPGHDPIEPVAKRIRAFRDGALVLDTTRALLLFEPRHLPHYWVPREDVRAAGTPAWAHTRDDLPALASYVHLDWDAMDAWFEEDEEVHVHPRNPYHRVDALRSSRHVEVLVDGVVVADSHRPTIVFETYLRPRYYLPKLDVRMELLRAETMTTGCAYKGRASYWSIEIDGMLQRQLAWSYAYPDPSVAAIAGLVAFYDEKLEVRVDGRHG